MDLDTKVIAFEGDDGSGKTTLAATCVKMLELAGKKVLLVTNDNLPPYAKSLRAIITSEDMKRTSADVRALMFSSWLLNIQEELIQPNWGEYDFIIVDRTYLSTLVYQQDSIVLDIYADYLEQTLPIDILVYLELSGDTGIKRIRESRSTELDVFESASTLHEIERRKQLYDWLFKNTSAPNAIKLDANKPADDVAADFKEHLFDIMRMTYGDL